MLLEDFDYELPPELIARFPAPRRDDARLLVLNGSRDIDHRRVGDLPELLAPGDLLVINDTRVIPARLVGTKPTGGRVELLLVEARGDDGESQEWEALYRSSKPVRPNAGLDLGGGFSATLLEGFGDGRGRFRLQCRSGVGQAIARRGEVPLPPYLERAPDTDDRERYQTIYAREPGAVAAPTAGLHFTPALFDGLAARGVQVAPLTLHVGPGTFLPVRSERVQDHRMHAEVFNVPATTAEQVTRAKAEGRRVVAVGTTCVRTLESAWTEGGLRAGPGRTSLFILPGFRFRVVDLLLTNFHLPRSTLLMLVCAFAGREPLLDTYGEAIRAGYRFYSYGDAMLIR